MPQTCAAAAVASGQLCAGQCLPRTFSRFCSTASSVICCRAGVTLRGLLAHQLLFFTCLLRLPSCRRAAATKRGCAHSSWDTSAAASRPSAPGRAVTTQDTPLQPEQSSPQRQEPGGTSTRAARTTLFQCSVTALAMSSLLLVGCTPCTSYCFVYLRSVWTCGAAQQQVVPGKGPRGLVVRQAKLAGRGCPARACAFGLCLGEAKRQRTRVPLGAMAPAPAT